jgi:uncharacterized membrane protein
MRRYFLYIFTISCFVYGFFGQIQYLRSAEIDDNPLEAIDPTLQPYQDFYRAEVIEITYDQTRQSGKHQIRQQDSRVRIIEGPFKDQEIELTKTNLANAQELWVSKGQKVIVAKVETPNGSEYQIVDSYRLPQLIVMIVLFLVLAVAVGRWRGLTSIAGLVFTILVLIGFVVPQIVAGRDPLWISVVGSFMIAVVSIYFAHGFYKRTTIAVLSTVITLIISVGLSLIFVSLAKLSGAGNEEAVYIQSGYLNQLNLSGLLLGGILIGTLGILNDVTTAQSAAVDEIKKAQSQIGFRELYKSGMSVGAEHIASLVNTLVLAYAAVGLPTFILFTLNRSQPAWVALNSAPLAEEIIRTVIGSIALILAVPVATGLAAYYFSRQKQIIVKERN